MNTKHLLITLVMVLGLVGVMPVFAAESETPGYIVNPSFNEGSAPSGTPAAGTPEQVKIPGWDLKDRLPVTSIYSMEHR